MSSHPSPFSQQSRLAMIEDYFGGRPVALPDAWKHVYRLLLWADPTTGLAHCYESDKAQPGRPWYERSLAFHSWLAEEFGVEPQDLGDELDFMFTRAMEAVVRNEMPNEGLSPVALQQRARFPDSMPLPGQDPELFALLEPLLAPHLNRESPEVRRFLLEARAQVTSENKRKNLLGRGFEDVLAEVIRRLPGADGRTVATQTLIEDVPGFRAPRGKKEKVDLHVVTASGRRVMVSAKWSVRADREKQMAGDQATYAAVNDGDPFDYVWVTNEFDPARLAANAKAVSGNSWLLTSVVHINLDAVRVVHDGSRGTSAMELPGLMASGRIIGLTDWLASLNS